MSNPLLQPKDDRFRRPTVPSEGGVNPYSEDAAVVLPEAQQVDGDSAGQPVTPASDQTQSTSPYIATYPHRGGVILTLGVTAIAALVLGIVGVTSAQFTMLVFFPIALPPGIAAWVLGRHDLLAIQAGAMNAEGRDKTRLGVWLGMVAVLGTALLMLTAVALYLLLE